MLPSTGTGNLLSKPDSQEVLAKILARWSVKKGVSPRERVS
jgi:hypothetical protein